MGWLLVIGLGSCARSSEPANAPAPETRPLETVDDAVGLTHIEGHVTAHDGSPLVNGMVELRVWQRRRLAWIPLAPDGRFSFETEYRGFVQVTISGAGHAPMRFGVVADGSALELVAQAGTLALASEFDQVQGRGQMGRHGHARQLVFERQADGSWRARVDVSETERAAMREAAANEQPRDRQPPELPDPGSPVSQQIRDASMAFWHDYQSSLPRPDEFAYLVWGITEGVDWHVPGTQADRYTHAGTGSSSVVRGDASGVTILFDPAAMPPSARAPQLTVNGTTPEGAALADATLAAEQWRALAAAAPPDASPTQTLDTLLLRAQAQIDAAPTEAQRDAIRVVALRHASWTPHRDHPGYAAMARDALNSMPPDDPRWSVSGGVVAGALEAVGDAPEWIAYGDRVIAEHHDPEVAASIVVRRLRAADERGDRAAARQHWDRLQRGALAWSSAARSAAVFSPDRPSAPGRPVPAFSVPALDPDAPAVTPETMAGRPYLLALWASWCGPCVDEMEAMHGGYAELNAAREGGVEFLSISMDDDVRTVADFRATRWPMPWRHAIATTEEQREALREAFSSRALPFHVLVDAEGTVVSDRIDLHGADVAATVADLLDAEP